MIQGLCGLWKCELLKGDFRSYESRKSVLGFYIWIDKIRIPSYVKGEYADMKLCRTAVNFITLLRMIGTMGLLFLRPMSPQFLLIYLLAGITDVLDGWLARKTGTASEFGARLDSIADLLFYAVMLIRIFPVLWERLPVQTWYAVAGILVLRLISYCTAAIKYRRFASLHTWLNKMTGAAVFLLPYILTISSGVVYSWAVCALACAASLEELVIHLCRKSYCSDTKSIFQMYH